MIFSVRKLLCGHIGRGLHRNIYCHDCELDKIPHIRYTLLMKFILGDYGIILNEQGGGIMKNFSQGYALLIGVGDTIYPEWSLPVTVKDVSAIQSVLTDSSLCAYENDEQHFRVLHDNKATKDAILDGLSWLKLQISKNSEATVVVYYSGHGWLNETTQKYYLIPHDVVPYDIEGTALAAETFISALRDIEASRLLVFIDSCHAEGMATSKDLKFPKLPPNFVQTMLPKGHIEHPN